MKKIVLTALTLIVYLIGQAQDKGFINLSPLGGSFAVGEFSSTDFTKSNPGLAQTGNRFDINAGVKFHEKIGAQILLRAQINPLDVQAMSNYLASISSAGTKGSVTSAEWAVFSILVGTYASFKLSNKFVFEPRILAGYTSMANPDLNITLTNGTSSSWVKQSSITGGGFGYLLGAGLKYNLSKRWHLNYNLDYTGASVSFKGIKTTSSAGTTETSDGTVEFSSINTGIGIGYNF